MRQDSLPLPPRAVGLLMDEHSSSTTVTRLPLISTKDYQNLLRQTKQGQKQNAGLEKDPPRRTTGVE
jgi:hypothetical protein